MIQRFIVFDTYYVYIYIILECVEKQSEIDEEKLDMTMGLDLLFSAVGKWNRYQIISRETSCSTMGTARTAVGWTGTESTVEKNGSKSNQLSWKIP